MWADEVRHGLASTFVIYLSSLWKKQCPYKQFALFFECPYNYKLCHFQVEGKWGRESCKAGKVLQKVAARIIWL